MVDKVETIKRLEELADYFYQLYLDEENLEHSLEAKDRYAVIQDTLELLDNTDVGDYNDARGLFKDKRSGNADSDQEQDK